MGQLAEFASNHPYHVLSVALALGAVLFYEIRLRGSSQHQVSVADAVRLINKGAVVVDVRKPDEYAAGHILNARHVELGEIEKNPNAVKKRKNKAVLTVCENGFGSNRAAGALRKAGFEHVYSLKSGLAAWRGENLPLVK